MAESHTPGPVIENIQSLVDRARDSGIAVIWVQHSDDGLPLGTPGWDYVPELVRREGEPLIHKTYGDSFEATGLEDVLAHGGIGRLVVARAAEPSQVPSQVPKGNGLVGGIVQVMADRGMLHIPPSAAWRGCWNVAPSRRVPPYCAATRAPALRTTVHTVLPGTT